MDLHPHRSVTFDRAQLLTKFIAVRMTLIRVTLKTKFSHTYVLTLIRVTLKTKFSHTYAFTTA
jgi:hypothetical protein